MVNFYIALGVCAVCLLTELIHLHRTKKLSSLAFGPDEKPRPWTRLTIIFKPLAAGALCWGLLTLLPYKGEPKDVSVEAEELAPEDVEHIVIIMDVSPSMYLEDAGDKGLMKRKVRAKEILESMIKRITSRNVRYSLVATFTDALPVVIDSSDKEVISNILELPMDQAFAPGKTDLISGVKKAFEIAKDWEPGSCTCILVSDGDTTSETGMPSPPSSVKHFIAAGVGSSSGAFIDGHQSRQDAISLKRIATRLRGDYEDVNTNHISTKILGDLAGVQAKEEKKNGPREIALICCGIGSFLLALIPALLNIFGFNNTANQVVRRELKLEKGNS